MSFAIASSIAMSIAVVVVICIRAICARGLPASIVTKTIVVFRL